MTLRERMGREVGGGALRLGKTRTPMAGSCQFLSKNTKIPDRT